MKLKKELGLIETFCISSGAMISSGLFVLPALLYGDLGPSILITYFIASLLVLPTVLSKAELTTAMPKTGGIYFFTDRSMGPLMGTLGGFSAWFSLALKSAFALYGIGIFMLLFDSSIGELEIKLVAVGFCLLFMILNLVGAKLSARFQVAMVITLIAILVAYIVAGLFFIDKSRYTPFSVDGLSPAVISAGVVFVSFAGTTKVAAIAGEVKNPGRNLPLGMILSWGIVSLLYLAILVVTIGVLDFNTFESTKTPISEGGEVIFGSVGIFIMAVAGMLAFVSTGNAGIMAASRDPMAMSKDDLLPGALSKISRFGTPWVAIVLTTLFMIFVILFLDVEGLAKFASTLKLLLFIMANLALIFMRESNMRHYRPKYMAPFYPFLQIAGIVSYIILIYLMGFVSFIFAVLFLLVGILWYFLYSRGRIKREYALLHVAEELRGKERSVYMLDEELREILVDRDNIHHSRLKKIIDEAVVINMDTYHRPEDLTKKLSHALSNRVGLDEIEVYKNFSTRRKESNIIVMPHFGIISYKIKGRQKFSMGIVRFKNGAMIEPNNPPVNAAFVIIYTKDENNFFLNSLMWLHQISDRIDWKGSWIRASSDEELKRMILKGIEETKRL